MLTIDEIKNVSFRKASLNGGYKAEDVDAFIDEVIASFEQLKKEKTNLVHKIDRLATRVEEYRADEETVRNALLTSQKMSDACIREAREKAARIIRDAEEKAKTITSEAERKTALEKENYLKLHADAVSLRDELIDLYRTHIQTIDDLPTEADLKQREEELNKQYPTPVIETPAAVPAAVPSDVAEDLAEAAADTNLTSNSVPSDDGTKVARRSSKFAHLKFGDNYDVSAD